MRSRAELYPCYDAEIKAIDQNGFTNELISRIITRHAGNSRYNRDLYERYQALQEAVPIFQRKPRFEDEKDAINNKINNDFFGEIIDMKVGYFAGVPVSYSYADTMECKEDTAEQGDSMRKAEEARDEAAKALSDFVTRNNMYDVDMETTKYAAICGYSGRLLYTDKEGNERVQAIPPYETVILSTNGDISEPDYAIRYYRYTDINDTSIIKVEAYNGDKIEYWEGDINRFEHVEDKPNFFGYCPLQGVANNKEMLGDAEKVIELIDSYDKGVSDNGNEVESFANAYMVYENVNISDDEIAKSQKSGAIKFYSGAAEGKVYFLTKDNSGTFIENHLDRIEENIYRFSKTPNLSDEAFGNSTGVALKFKLTGLEAKCGTFQAKMITAGTYMFKLWAEAMAKRKIKVDYLQCCMEFTRCFPLDTLSDAQAAQALIGAGLPKRVAYQMALPQINDIDYVMDLIEQEMDSIPPLSVDNNDDSEDFTPEETPEDNDGMPEE